MFTPTKQDCSYAPNERFHPVQWLKHNFTTCAVHYTCQWLLNVLLSVETKFLPKKWQCSGMFNLLYFFDVPTYREKRTVQMHKHSNVLFALSLAKQIPQWFSVDKNMLWSWEKHKYHSIWAVDYILVFAIHLQSQRKSKGNEQFLSLLHGEMEIIFQIITCYFFVSVYEISYYDNIVSYISTQVSVDLALSLHEVINTCVQISGKRGSKFYCPYRRSLCELQFHFSH